MLIDANALSVLVERRAEGLLLVIHVPAELAAPATEMVEELGRQLGPSGSAAGAAIAVGALAGLVDGAQVSNSAHGQNRSQSAA